MSRSDNAASGEAQAPAGPYRVLARRYRPATFDDLIGQDALVRTLTNALETGRMPQAFVLTGVRGVGKTTTARIIARALTCTGPDGTGGPTSRPCGECGHCTAIAGDRHLDVIEMDAASRTGVQDIRDLLDGVNYRPVSARRKIYIVDEVHMLSTQAFNALLKTLEEPPEHITFIFATTEIRKVPVTVLSRCMRFDLRRVEHATLVAHLNQIAAREGIAVEDEGLAMVARAADGSVRDALSLMDQAVALDGGAITAERVKDMLGLTDRTRVYDLYDAVLAGRAAEAVGMLGELYDAGADPGLVIQDLLTVTHTLTRLQVVGDSEVMAGLPEAERTRGREMADAVRASQLTRNWQILLKGLQETQAAPEPRQAAEMVLIRLMYAAELPPPAELVRALRGDPGEGGGTAGSAGAPGPAPRPESPPTANAPGASPDAGSAGGAALAESPPAPRGPTAAAPASDAPEPASLREIVELCRARREPRLGSDLRRCARPVRVEPGVVELSPTAEAPGDLANRLKRFLTAHTARDWMVSLTDGPGEPTLKEQDERADRARREDVLRDPNVQRVLAAFPEAELVDHRPGGTAPTNGGGEP